MQKVMTMERDLFRTTVRRRSDGLAQIHVLPAPPFGLGTMRTLWIALAGATLLVASLLATPFWFALGTRHASQGQGGTPHILPPK
jgi:hypothetical protein